jgi:hypothetical protein
LLIPTIGRAVAIAVTYMVCDGALNYKYPLVSYPKAECQAGPFDQSPIGTGFDYFHGFLDDHAGQWKPILFRKTKATHPHADHPK